MELLAIAIAVGGLSMYGIVRSSLQFAERFQEKEKNDLERCSLEQLHQSRNKAIEIYDWWSMVSDDALRVRECKKAMEIVARIDEEYTRRLRAL